MSLELPKWDELFEKLWNEKVVQVVSLVAVAAVADPMAVIKYQARDIVLRVMQNALVPKVREIKRFDPNCVHITYTFPANRQSFF